MNNNIIGCQSISKGMLRWKREFYYHELNIRYLVEIFARLISSFTEIESSSECYGNVRCNNIINRFIVLFKMISNQSLFIYGFPIIILIRILNGISNLKIKWTKRKEFKRDGRGGRRNEKKKRRHLFCPSKRIVKIVTALTSLDR